MLTVLKYTSSFHIQFSWISPVVNQYENIAFRLSRLCGLIYLNIKLPQLDLKNIRDINRSDRQTNRQAMWYFFYTESVIYVCVDRSTNVWVIQRPYLHGRASSGRIPDRIQTFENKHYTQELSQIVCILSKSVTEYLSAKRIFISSLPAFLSAF